MAEPTQEVFLECYRGRQTALHHMAYMRMSKVLPALHMMRRTGFSPRERSVFDYGFGAGTLFRYLPRDAELFGVETDPENVLQVREMLERRGHPQVDLQTVEVSSWEQHPLLNRNYDLVVCSSTLR